MDPKVSTDLEEIPCNVRVLYLSEVAKEFTHPVLIRFTSAPESIMKLQFKFRFGEDKTIAGARLELKALFMLEKQWWTEEPLENELFSDRFGALFDPHPGGRHGFPERWWRFPIEFLKYWRCLASPVSKLVYDTHA